VISSIKMVKYFKYTKEDIILTVLTDSAFFHKARLWELAAQEGEFSLRNAAVKRRLRLPRLATDHLAELPPCQTPAYP